MKNKKIDIFFSGKYLFSTTSYANCKSARQALLNLLKGNKYKQTQLALIIKLNAIDPEYSDKKIKAFYAK